MQLIVSLAWDWRSSVAVCSCHKIKGVGIAAHHIAVRRAEGVISSKRIGSVTMTGISSPLEDIVSR